jgi:hypothetical protein
MLFSFKNNFVRENLWEDYLWERDGEGRTVEGF